MNVSDQPTNNQRAAWANTAISAMAVETGSTGEDQATLIQDVLCNLRHLCDAEGLNFERLSDNACSIYVEEAGEQPLADVDYAGAGPDVDAFGDSPSALIE